MGHSEQFEEALVDALNVAIGLIRSPLSLALDLLELPAAEEKPGAAGERSTAAPAEGVNPAPPPEGTKVLTVGCGLVH